MNSVTFKSKLDGWVAASLLAASLVQVVVLVALAAKAPAALLVALPLVLVISAFVAWLYVATRYEVTDDHLLIRAGIVSVDVPLAQITRVEETRNPISAPAWSLDRLLISYGHDRSCIISPKNKERFLEILRERGARVA